MASADPFPLAGKRIWVAGHRGMVGAALLRRLARENCTVLTVGRAELDLTRQRDTEDWIADQKPDAVILAAAKVGGILANDAQPVDFLLTNLQIETNTIAAAYRAGVRKLLFLGSSCIYPKHASQPLREEALLTGSLEPTNQWYAVAKIAGIKLCQAYRRQHGADFIAAMPTNLYGPEDNFDLASGHVLPALIRRAHAAKLAGAECLAVWGTGRPRREFLHVDDCADALVHLLKTYSEMEHINVGTGRDIEVARLAALVASVVGYAGRITFDAGKPDGTPRKLMNVDKLTATGWTAGIGLEDGIRSTYDWFLAQDRAPGSAPRGT